MADRLPESLVSLYAVAVRDVLWFRHKVEEYLRRAGVPGPIMSEVRDMGSAPTIKKCLRVVDLLEQSGAKGQQILQTLMSEVADRADLSHLKSQEDRVRARASQEALKTEIRAYADRQRYRERKEREQHQEREAKGKPRPLDHAKLQSFRDRFDATYGESDRQARGNALEALLNEIFDYYCPDSRGPFRRTGEQVDGHFRYDGHDYICEIRWREEQANAADVSVLRDRAAAGFGGDVRALFISFYGFTTECIESLRARAGQERVLLMDGVDLRAVLNADIAFDILLAEKQAWAVRSQRAFVSAREIIVARMTAGSND